MHRVAIIDAHRRKVITTRPIKKNFCRRGFTTYLDQTGRTNRELELAFSGVEGHMLNQIRSITPANCGPEKKAAVANLFAVHMVRSPAFKTMHERILRDFRANQVPNYATEPKLAVMFAAQYGREPKEGEIQQIALSSYDRMASDPAMAVNTTSRQHDQIAERLNNYYMQLIIVNPELPGFAIGDVPVIHAQTYSGRHGFRDHLAVGDANLILGPLSRRMAACFSAKPFQTSILTSAEAVDTVNAVFIRAALNEVACHPEDSEHLAAVSNRLDQLPIERLLIATAGT